MSIRSIVKTFNSDNSNIADNAFFTVITFSNINSLNLNQFYLNKSFIRTNYEKLFQRDFHQDNLPFACIRFYKHNCLNILAGDFFS